MAAGWLRAPPGPRSRPGAIFRGVSGCADTGCGFKRAAAGSSLSQALVRAAGGAP